MSLVPYRLGRATPEGRKLIKSIDNKPNPIQSSVRIIPIHKMMIGDSLFFHVEEMLESKIRDARNCAKKYGRLHGDMFGFIKHRDKERGYYMLEIVRIK